MVIADGVGGLADNMLKTMEIINVAQVPNNKEGTTQVILNLVSAKTKKRTTNDADNKNPQTVNTLSPKDRSLERLFSSKVKISVALTTSGFCSFRLKVTLIMGLSQFTFWNYKKLSGA